MTRVEFLVHHSLSSQLIHWWTRGFSHARIRLADGRVLEALFFGGVRVRDPGTENLFAFASVTLPFDIEQAAMKYIGEAYNWKALVAFFFRFRWRSPHHLYCNELILKACADVGRPMVQKGREDLTGPQETFELLNAYLLGRTDAAA